MPELTPIRIATVVTYAVCLAAVLADLFLFRPN
jgi:hypothetical protein